MKNRTINTLELNNTKLGNEFAKSIASALKVNKNIIWLSLSIFLMKNEKNITKLGMKAVLQ